MAELTKNDLKNIKGVFTEALEPFAKAIQEDLAEVKSDLAGVKSEVAEVKSDLGLMKIELREVKKDVKWMKDNTGQIFAKFDDLITLLKDQRQELVFLRAQVKRLEDRVEKLELR